MNKTIEIPVVIPYLASQAQGRELEYAVAGWRRHFQEPHHIYIVGDYHPVTQTGDDITFVPCPRVADIPGQYRPHLDHVNKFRLMMELLGPDCQGFIYACDDMYAVRDFNLADVKRPKVADIQIPPIDWERQTGWWRDAGKTREYCLENGWPVNNWVCHLPVWFDFDKLFSLEVRDESFVWENLYYNKYFPKKEPARVGDRCKWKYEVKTSSPGIDTAERARAIWITNANCGWSPELETILKNHYGV